MSKIKEKLNDSICFVKENPIGGLAKYLPIFTCVLSILLTLISLFMFTTSGGFSHQSIQFNQNFSHEGANLPATKFVTTLVDLLYLANIIVILTHYYQTQTKSKRIVVVGLFVVGVIAKILFYLCLFEGKPNYVVWAVLAILFFIGIFTYETNEMTKHMMISYIVVKIVLPVILFVVENIGAVVGNILYVVIFGVVFWILIHIFLSADFSSSNSTPSSTTLDKVHVSNESNKEQKKDDKNKVRIIEIDPTLKVIIVKNFLGFYFVRTKNFMGIQRELCPLKDMEQGKVKLIWQDTKKEIPLSRIPYEENAK